MIQFGFTSEDMETKFGEKISSGDTDAVTDKMLCEKNRCMPNVGWKKNGKCFWYTRQNRKILVEISDPTWNFANGQQIIYLCIINYQFKYYKL